jgi:hypothetical protein
MAPNSPRARLGGLAVLLALCVLAAGCAGNKKITQANFEKIKNDMSLSEVEAILGPGDKQGDGSNVAAQAGVDVNMGAAPSSTVDYVWESGTKKITITFRGGKVVGKTSSGL